MRQALGWIFCLRRFSSLLIVWKKKLKKLRLRMTWDWRWKILSVQRLKLAFDHSNFHKLQRKSFSRMEDETLAYHSQPAVHIPHRRVIPLVILSYLLSQVHLNVSNNFTLRGKSTKNIQDMFYFCIQGISLLCLLFSSASCAERVKGKRRKKKALSSTWSNFLFHHQTNAFCVLSAFTLASFSEERICHLSLHQNNGLVLVMTRGSARIHPHFSPPNSRYFASILCSFVVQQQRGFNYATLLLYKHRMHGWEFSRRWKQRELEGQSEVYPRSDFPQRRRIKINRKKRA